MAEPADGPQALHKHPLPRDFSASTCKAAWDLWWDSARSSFSCSCALWSSAGGTQAKRHRHRHWGSEPRLSTTTPWSRGAASP